MEKDFQYIGYNDAVRIVSLLRTKKITEEFKKEVISMFDELAAGTTEARHKEIQQWLSDNYIGYTLVNGIN